jgi:tetratricopeptide (TPR) repeat protein
VLASSRTIRKRVYAGLIAVSWAIATFGSFPCYAEDADVPALLAEAEASYDRWSEPFDFAAYETSLRRAIDLWKEALPLLPADDDATRVEVLNRLSRAYFELATGYLEESREKEAAFEAGKGAALAALELDPAFVETRERDGFRAALRAANDVASIFWYGNNLGQWLDFHRFTAFFGGVRDVQASFERAIELDETYASGGPHRSMAALLVRAYFLVGRSREDAVAHFERSIELDPTYLENCVNYAEYYARPVGDDALFDTLIATVLEAAEEPSVVAAHPFYNELAIDRARSLTRP